MHACISFYDLWKKLKEKQLKKQANNRTNAQNTEREAI